MLKVTFGPLLSESRKIPHYNNVITLTLNQMRNLRTGIKTECKVLVDSAKQQTDVVLILCKGKLGEVLKRSVTINSLS